MSKIILKTPAEIELLRDACKVTSDILDALQSYVTPGISTEDINSFVHDLTLKNDARPAPLNYRGFPKSVCTSKNEVVCHGVPSPYDVLEEGDILNIDVTSIKNGFYGDASRMFFIGGEKACSPESVELVNVTKEALHVGIDAVKPGVKLGNIGASIAKFIKSKNKDYGIVKDYTGHGIGRSFHEDPQVVHNADPDSGPVLEEGMTFTIEPMINMGTHKTVLSRVDGWTVRTEDGKLSAQWEHTIAVVKDGCEVLTDFS